jgi:transcription initiation factor TFIIIB Brf1 subunit/transcription initiation factor TFIIB
MTIWEKAILNMQKGTQKIADVAAVFSERVKAELVIVRLRIRIGEIQARINELYGTIGRKVVELKNKEEVPKTSEELLLDEEIAAAMNELVQQKKEIEELESDIKSEQDAFKPAPKQTEDTVS